MTVKLMKFLKLVVLRLRCAMVRTTNNMLDNIDKTLKEFNFELMAN